MSSPAKTESETAAQGAGAPAGLGAADVAHGGDGAGRPRTPAAERSTVSAARDTIHHPAPGAFDLAQILRTVGDPLRLAMVRDLAAHDELLCGALGDRLGLPKSTGSYHLRLLREAGLTRIRQEGTLRYVSLRRADLEGRFPGLVDVLASGERD